MNVSVNLGQIQSRCALKLSCFYLFFLVDTQIDFISHFCTTVLLNSFIFATIRGM